MFSSIPVIAALLAVSTAAPTSIASSNIQINNNEFHQGEIAGFSQVCVYPTTDCTNLDGAFCTSSYTWSQELRVDAAPGAEQQPAIQAFKFVGRTFTEDENFAFGLGGDVDGNGVTWHIDPVDNLAGRDASECLAVTPSKLKSNKNTVTALKLVNQSSN